MRRWCPIPQTAARYIADDLKITFTGGRKYRHPRETTAFNAKRYKWVKKKMERTDVVAGEGETIVYNLGTLYGEWPDGTPFEGNRYVDRFVVRDGKIVQMDVWNDSAERLLTKARDRGLVLSLAGLSRFARRLSSLPLDACARLPAQARRSIVGVTRQNGLDVVFPWRARHDQRAPGDGLQMLVHHRGRAFGIAGGERGDDRAMLAHRAFRGMRPAVEREDQAAARRDLADIARQDRASGHLGEHDVKLGREPDRQRFVGAAGLLLVVDMGFELFDLLGGQPAGEPRDDQPFEPEPDVEHIAGLVPARRRDRRAAVAAKLDQAFGGELPQHMAHDRAARAEAFADRILGKLGARRQRLLDDGVAQARGRWRRPDRCCCWRLGALISARGRPRIARRYAGHG